MDYLRFCGIPVPEIYGYSTTTENPANTEYILMQVCRGRKLGDIWFELGEMARTTLVKKLVEIEARLLQLEFPVGGGLYYIQDLKGNLDRVEIASRSPSKRGTFCIGPDLTQSLWYGNRLALDTSRGPCKYR